MTAATLYSSTTQLCGRDVSHSRCLLYSSFICSLIHVQLCTKYENFSVCQIRYFVEYIIFECVYARYAKELMGFPMVITPCVHP